MKDLVNKFAHVRFEPSWFTGNQEIPIAKSIVDYIFRWLGSRFLDTDDKASLGLIDRSQVSEPAADSPAQSTTAFGAQRSAPASPPPASSAVAPNDETPSTLAAAPGIGSDGEGAHTETSEAASPPTASEAQSGDSDVPKATAVAASPAEAGPGDALKVIATNGHAANGGSKTGNGNGGGTSAITLNLGATKVSFQTQADAPSCADCGSIMVRNGSCYKCLNCGSTSGCS